MFALELKKIMLMDFTVKYLTYKLINHFCLVCLDQQALKGDKLLAMVSGFLSLQPIHKIIEQRINFNMFLWDFGD